MAVEKPGLAEDKGVEKLQLLSGFSLENGQSLMFQCIFINSKNIEKKLWVSFRGVLIGFWSGFRQVVDRLLTGRRHKSLEIFVIFHLSG